MKKGQSAMEFMILIGFLLFAFVMFFALINFNMSDKIKERNNQRLYEVAFTIKSEIDLAHDSLDGYSRNFSLPEKISGIPYEVKIDSGLVSVRTLDGQYALGLPVRASNGSVILGNNRIRRENGTVFINQ